MQGSQSSGEDFARLRELVEDGGRARLCHRQSALTGDKDAIGDNVKINT